MRSPESQRNLTILITCKLVHEDWTKKVTFNILNPPGGHVFQPTMTIFKYWKINVTSRVKNALHPGGHVFLSNRTYFELVQNNIETHVLTKFHEYWTKYVASRFHEDWTTYVASRVFTR
ncbi:hypothetical protein DPMN_020745 [Dreissena polymorpha]|uniref:Uncharacterized protein n=1 Tax=Dreissena polymorpha TaxID=45954 RepID=A0A9D4NHC1_DREPO|nr:hypothetical protein DPMN_020745 [Dreissena polymorpha]